jgi:hypothetical protein
MAEPGFARWSTFSRTLTFTPEMYNRAIVQPLEGLQRTFTETHRNRFGEWGATIWKSGICAQQ